ncbi:MAG TPA: hypothetical protein VL970_12550, partial [Candidatus Acidoferrales bacterium]|nr:hypothetical protein [Candidatus Acidoferrales bacterium]
NKRPAMANWPVPFYNQGWESLLYWEEKSGILIAYIIANEHIMNMMRRVRNTLAFVLLSFCSGRSKKQYQQLTTRNRYEE